MQLLKKFGAVAVALVMATATILPMVSVDVSAGTLEETDFNYAYDVQRNPAYPVKGDTVTMDSLNNPVKGEESGTTVRYDSPEDDWKLEVAGKYSELTDKSTGLTNVAEQVKTEYGFESADDFIVHKLLKGAELVAHGIVVAYDADKGMVIFLGDSLDRSAGYLLTTTAQNTNDRVTMVATQIATDISENTPSNPPADNNDTDTPAADDQKPDQKPADKSDAESSPKTGDDSNAALWMALLMLSGAALAGFGVNRKYNAN